jgi:RNA polymerase-binding transcription factor DksA
MSAPFAPSTLAEFADRLEQLRHTSSRLASSLYDDAARALEDFDLSDLLDNDNPDGGTSDSDRALALHLAQLAALNASAAADALERLAAGSYGICERCGERIPLARLRALPETRVCVSCKVTGGSFPSLDR